MQRGDCLGAFRIGALATPRVAPTAAIALTAAMAMALAGAAVVAE